MRFACLVQSPPVPQGDDDDAAFLRGFGVLEKLGLLVILPSP